MELVKLEKQGKIGILTMNRPEALNALSFEVLNALNEMLDVVSSDDDIDVVIITGEGRSFVAGADIGQMKDLSSIQGKKWSEFGNYVFMRIENMSKPFIAAINGFCLGGGNELAMSCDIRLASQKAKFGQPEVGLGITPGFGGTQRLPRIVGMGQAMELTLTGKIIDATQAKNIGLVNEIYAPEELLDKAIELAEQIVVNAQIAVRESKRVMRMGAHVDMQAAVELEALAFGVCCGTEDKVEGMSAFLEKRAKNFKNN